MKIIIISSKPEALRDALAPFAATATVEAEYGDVLVEGTIATLAHHGPRSANPAPCLYDGPPVGGEAIGLSHFDLDTLGGVLALQGLRPFAPSFWALAAFVDVHGPHKLGEAGASAEDVARLHAWWAWSEKHRVFAPRDGAVADVTADVERAVEVLGLILDGDPGLLGLGTEWAEEKERLNAESFVERIDDVIVRVHSEFVSGLYVDPAGRPAKAVVRFDPVKGSITLSLADPIPGVSCRALVQSLWGPEAGGHAGIAGSPRDRRMGLDDLVQARNALVFALMPASYSRMTRS